jgi:hypothetical protein
MIGQLVPTPMGLQADFGMQFAQVNFSPQLERSQIRDPENMFQQRSAPTSSHKKEKQF